MDATFRSVRMIADGASFELMSMVSKKMGIEIEVLADGKGFYSYRGGEGTSVVPEGSKFVSIHAGNQIAAFWDLVSKEKTKQREAWLAAHPL